MVAQDRTLDRKYRLGRVLQTGERALIVEGTHLELRERVAIKILQKEQTDPRYAAQLRREARQAAAIHSDHVVRYLDIGHLGDGRPYVVMERLVGEPLSARVARGKLSAIEAVDVVLETCDALAAAHSRKILHRDLRTSNLFCVERPDKSFTVKVLNFGNARAPKADGEKEDEGLTVTALALDAPDYKAPEQIGARRDLDARVDIWSLGVIFYELLTGWHPFTAASMQETLARVLSANVQPVNEIPQDLWPIVQRCLRLRREERFSDVAELAESLTRFASPRTLGYPQRIRQTLEHPPAAEHEEEAENAPTVVRDVLAAAEPGTSGPHSGTAKVLAPKVSTPAPADSSLPRLDNGRTGARSWPWQKAPTSRSTMQNEVGRRSTRPPKASWTSAAIALTALVALPLTTGVILRRIIVDVHVESRDPEAPTQKPAPPPIYVPPAPTPTIIYETVPAETAAAPPSTPTPAPARTRARAQTRTERQDTRTSAPSGGDPWGWDR